MSILDDPNVVSRTDHSSSAPRPGRGRPPKDVSGRVAYRTNSVANQFLATLWPSDFDQLRPYLSAVELRQHDVLTDLDRLVENVYFIERGGVSRTKLAPRGSPAEDAMVGHLGYVGLSAVLGSAHALHRTVVVVPGLALRISVSHLNLLMHKVGSLRGHLLQYAPILVSHREVISDCNAKHDLETRLARWLLTTHDAATSDNLLITRGLPAQMLGANHLAISTALRRLEASHAIVRRERSISIRNRAALETCACECYRRAYQHCALSGAIHHAHWFSCASAQR